MSTLRRLFTGRPGETPRGDSFSRSGLFHDPTGTFIAIVRRFHEIEGRVYLDCYDPMTIENFKRVPLMVPAADNSERFFRPAVAEDGAVPTPVTPGETSTTVQAVIARRGLGSSPICIGFVRQEAVKTAALTAPVPETGADRSVDDYARDHTMKNAGAVFVVGSDGSIVLQTPDSTNDNDAVLRAQLGSSSQLRISRGGDASEKLVLAGPLLKYIEVLETRITQLFTQVESIKDDLNSLSLATNVPIATTSITASDADVTGATSLLVSSVIEVSKDAQNAVE